MTEELSIDNVMKFPCEIAIKAMGKNTDTFANHVLQLVLLHCPEITEKMMHTRPSKSDNFLAVTIKITAQDRAHADRVYQSLSDDDLVIIAI